MGMLGRPRAALSKAGSRARGLSGSGPGLSEFSGTGAADCQPVFVPPAAPGAAPAADSPRSCPSGWLWKQSGGKGTASLGHITRKWSKRWFVLRSRSLCYYETEQADKLLGSVDLLAATVSVLPADKDASGTFDGVFSFSVKAAERELALRVGGREAAAKWLLAIYSAISGVSMESTSAEATAAVKATALATGSSSEAADGAVQRAAGGLEVVRYRLRRGGDGLLGLDIMDAPELHVFNVIVHIVPRSPSATDGLVRLGDVVLAVDGTRLMQTGGGQVDCEVACDQVYEALTPGKPCYDFEVLRSANGLSDALKQRSDSASLEGNFAVLPARANVFAHAAKAAAKHERLVHDKELRRERV